MCRQAAFILPVNTHQVQPRKQGKPHSVGLRLNNSRHDAQVDHLLQLRLKVPLHRIHLKVVNDAEPDPLRLRIDYH